MINFEKAIEISKELATAGDQSSDDSSVDNVYGILNRLGLEIKKNEAFVEDVYKNISNDGKDFIFPAILDYFDSALYVASLIEEIEGGAGGDDNPEDTEEIEANVDYLLELLSKGWDDQRESWDEGYKSQQFRNITSDFGENENTCETTDLITVIENHAEDEGFDTVQNYILSEFQGMDWSLKGSYPEGEAPAKSFCIKMLQDYYADNIQYELKRLKASLE